jgi:cyclic pyranopterin phosphate synthase
MAPETLTAIRHNTLAKGDVLATARIAGILGAKKTAELIPLCHSLSLDDVQVQCDLDDALPGIRVSATATTSGKTGVEMEALTAVSLALLTIYDMAKALDRGMTLTAIALQSKSGGRSGTWNRA